MKNQTYREQPGLSRRGRLRVCLLAAGLLALLGSPRRAQAAALPPQPDFLFAHGGEVNPAYADVIDAEALEGITPEEAALERLAEGVIRTYAERVAAGADEAALKRATADTISDYAGGGSEGPGEALASPAEGALRQTEGTEAIQELLAHWSTAAEGGGAELSPLEASAEEPFTTVAAAAEELLAQFKAREPSIALPIRITIDGDDSIYQELLDIDAEIDARLTEALADTSLSEEERASAISSLESSRRNRKFPIFYRYLWRSSLIHHTEDPTGGDYAAYQYGGYRTSLSPFVQGELATVITGTTIQGNLVYHISNAAGETHYYTTAEQEAELTARLNTVMDGLFPADATEDGKITAIYDYICSHVKYDFNHPSTYRLKYTAYAALINGTAVCQGYASLFYRMALTAGIDNRIISGYAGENHAWNLLWAEDAYYYGDTTWDAGVSPQRWFLRGSDNFTGHVANHETSQVQYQGHTVGARPNWFTESDYPISAADYLTSFPIRYQGTAVDDRYTTAANVRSSITFPRPERAGYTFAGWYYDSTYRRQVPETSYDAATGLYTLPRPTRQELSEGLTLYPKFLHIYGVTLQIPTGAQIQDPGVFTPDLAGLLFTAPRGIAAKIELPKTVTYPGRRFTGWVDTDRGETCTSVTGSGNRSFEATFAPWQMTMRYDLDKPAGSKIKATAPKEQVLYGSAFALPELEATGTHVFAGWSCGSVSGGDILAPGAHDLGSPLTADRELTWQARWTPRSYTIDYRVWDTDAPLASSVQTCGQALSLKDVTPESLGYRDRSNAAVYTFKGWYVKNDKGALGSRKTTVPSSNTEDLTLYAWYDIRYEVVLHGSVSAGDISSLSSGDARTDKTLRLSGFRTTSAKALSKYSRLTIPWTTPGGMVFAGWRFADSATDIADVTDGGKLAFAKDGTERKYGLLTQDQTPRLHLYAVYGSATGTQELRFFAGTSLYARGTRALNGTSTKLSDLTLTESESRLLTLLKTRSGYAFSYWRDRATGKKVTSLAKTDLRPVVVLDAVFTVRSVSVTYHNNYQSLPAGTKGKALTARAKSAYEASRLRKNTWKFEGYTFAGWSRTPEGAPLTDAAGRVTDAAALRTELGSGDAALYAIWTPATYAWHYDEGDRSFRTVYGTIPERLAGLPVPEARVGYRFAGWYRYKTDKKGLLATDRYGRLVETDTPATGWEIGDIYVYALWEEL